MNKARHVLVFCASCAFHGLVLVVLLVSTYLCQSHLPPKSGSAPGAPTITLSTLVIVSPPPPAPPPPMVTKPAPDPAPSPAPTPVAVETPPPPEPETKASLPETGVPVLAEQPVSPAPAKTEPVKISHPTHPMLSHTTTTRPSPKAATASVASSYSPGLSSLPHPPYPLEARDRRQTGTVIMNVLFNEHGDDVAPNGGDAIERRARP